MGFGKCLLLCRQNSKCLYFTRKGVIHSPATRFYLKLIHLPDVPSVKLLGFIFGNKLSWEPYLRQVRRKCQKFFNILRVISESSWSGDVTILFLLYLALIPSKTNYFSFITVLLQNTKCPFYRFHP